MRLTRRQTMAAALAGLAAGWARTAAAQSPARAEPVLLENGQYTQPWFLNSFLDLREDLTEAGAQGKRFAILWEQRGCPYCLETHRVNLADPNVNDYIRSHFNVLQLDLFGSREVTDFDGQVLAEKDLARKYGVAYTPTIQFFPEEQPRLEGKSSKSIEVARMPGYFRPAHFRMMFEYVAERAYTRMPFPRFVQLAAEQGKTAPGIKN
jgi:thioredoxin-related protein